MQKKLTQQEIKDLKMQRRMGYILPFFLFALGSGGGVSVFIFMLNNGSFDINPAHIASIIVSMALVAVLISFGMNRKYNADIRYGVKNQEKKTVQKKEHKTDYEAGSGKMHINQKMNTLDVYSLIIENTRYPVKKELFDKVEENSKVIFNIAPNSQYLLGIEAIN